jgi:hypothetical protein
MNKKKIILGSSILVVGYLLMKSFFKKQSTSNTELVLKESDFECPLNKTNDPDYYKKYEERRKAYNKANPLAGLDFGFYRTAHSPNKSFAEAEFAYNSPSFSMTEDCSKEEQEQFLNRTKKVISNLELIGKKGLLKPIMNPTGMKLMAKKMGTFDPNKNYSRICGTEVCWVYNNNLKIWEKK